MAIGVPHLVADVEAGRGAPNAESSVLVGGALIGGGGLVAHERRAGIEGESLGRVSTRSGHSRFLTVRALLPQSSRPNQPNYDVRRGGRARALRIASANVATKTRIRVESRPR